MTRQNYLVFLRIIAAVTAIALWAISVNFSVAGFNFVVPNMAWAGLALGLAVTAIQLIWNRQGMSGNLTIIIVGLAAYAYGIYTNVMGIVAAQGMTPDSFVKILFPLLLGFFLEITPEPLLIWGLIGSNDEGDFLTNLFGWGERGIEQAKPTLRKAAMAPTLVTQQQTLKSRERAERKRSTIPSEQSFDGSGQAGPYQF